MRIKTLLAALVGLSALVLAGSAGAANFTVWAGPGFLTAAPAGAPQSADANVFFPSQLEIHVGDSVTFKSADFHTATYLGRHKAAEFPIFIPALDHSVYSGVNDAAGNPFYFNGQPKFWYNPQALAPSGSQSIGGHGQRGVQSSGVLSKQGYTFTFTKAGNYTINCLVHAPMMKMHVVVKPRHAHIQSNKQIRRSVARELSDAIKVAQHLDALVPATPNTVYAGIGRMVKGGSVELMTFKPQQLTVKVGTTVTFVNNSPMEIHNMVFGPADYVKQSFQTLDLTPMGPGQPNQVWPFFFYGSDPLSSPYSYNGLNHGNGFLATPVIGPMGSPLPNSFQITFTAPGSFKYICGIHGPMMNGEIDVVS